MPESCTAALFKSTTPVFSCTSRRTLTNWLGNSSIVGIVEIGAHAHRAGGLIDLVIDGGQLSRGQLLRVVAIPRVDAQLLAAAHLLVDRRKLVFGEREDAR